MKLKTVGTLKNIFVGFTTAAIPAYAHAAYAIPVMDDETRQMVAVAIVVYILPSIIAIYRKHPSKYSIILIDLFLGFTAIGWLVALIWSLSTTKQNVVVVSPTNPIPSQQNALAANLVSVECH